VSGFRTGSETHPWGPDSLVNSLSILAPWTRGSTGPTYKAGTDTVMESEWLDEAGSSRSIARDALGRIGNACVSHSELVSGES
jgi:hypothetical protein